MSRSALVAILAFGLALPASGQVVKVTQTDGKVVQGDLLGYEKRRYRLRLENGSLEEIEEARVQDVILISPTGDRPLGRDTGVLDAARSAFERNDLDLAMQKVAEALRSLDADRSQMAELAARVSTAYLERLLEQRDVVRFGDGLRQVVPTLTPAARKELYQKMAERLVDLDRSAPDSAFTSALADAVARLVDEGAIPEESRAALADLLVQRAQREAEKKDYGAALTLIKGAIRVDSKRREALKGLFVEVALAQARALLEKGDTQGAAQAAKDAAAVDPDSAEAKRVLEAVEFAVFRRRVESEVGGPALVQSLRTFMGRVVKPEEREWAEQALQRASSTSNPQSAQLSTYFPVKLGRTMVYRRGEGTSTERLHTDSVTHEGDLVRVYNTSQETYREYATTKSYLVEIERDAVYLPTTGEEREPLLKFPAQVGDSWSWQSRRRDFKRTVKSLGESVSVGREGSSRVFHDCLVVEFTSSVDREGVPVVLTSRSTYAPGVGLVKLEFLDAEFRKFNLDLLEEIQE